jgi:CPA1 family monovalent cation:H+ antiporter
VSWKGPLLISSATRLQGIFFWDLLVYLIEGLVFLVTGLEARALMDNGHAFSIPDLVTATLVTVGIVIAARFIWVFPATYLPRWLIPPLRRRDPSPPWQSVFVLAFTGIRGVVSLAAALAIPYATMSGAPFPHRDLILFVTFGVIIVTLIGQGLLLPSVVRWLGLARHGESERLDEMQAELEARQAALRQVEQRLEALAGEHAVPDDVLELLRTRNLSRMQILPRDLSDGLDHTRQSAALKKELINAERAFIYELLRDGRITDEARRRIEYELDLEEASLANRGHDGGGWF